MAITNEEREFVSYVVDQMQCIGAVEARRMFGGHGVFLQGLMFALIADGVLYLKADKESEDEFTSIGLERFTFMKKGKSCALSYFQSPEEALEDMDVMMLWANRAYAAAVRAAEAK